MKPRAEWVRQPPAEALRLHLAYAQAKLQAGWIKPRQKREQPPVQPTENGV